MGESSLICQKAELKELYLHLPLLLEYNSQTRELHLKILNFRRQCHGKILIQNMVGSTWHRSEKEVNSHKRRQLFCILLLSISRHYSSRAWHHENYNGFMHSTLLLWLAGSGQFLPVTNSYTKLWSLAWASSLPQTVLRTIWPIIAAGKVCCSFGDISSSSVRRVWLHFLVAESSDMCVSYVLVSGFCVRHSFLILLPRLDTAWE